MLAKRLLLVVCLSVAIGNGMSQLPQNQMMPKNLFRMMTNKTATTEEFLKNLAPDMLKNAIKIGSLPKPRKGSSTRNTGSSVSNILDLENQGCTILPYIHFLRQPDKMENALIWPYAIRIPRCFGSCNAHANAVFCTSIKSKNVIVPAYKLNYGGGNTALAPTFETVVVHEKCGCRCTVNQTVCQNYNMIFNKDYCRCDCPGPIPICSQSREWNEKTCKCECIGSESDNSDRCYKDSKGRGYWDKTTCSCKCHGCGRSRYYKQNPNTCECTCTIDKSDCAAGERFRRKRCMCR